MNAVEIQSKVIAFFVTMTGLSSIDEETELQDSGIVDSLMMMDLLVFIEAEFGVRLDFEDLTPEVFQTPATISRLVHSRVAVTQRS